MIGTVRGRAGCPVSISGYAQDFDAPIAGVQFSLDEGRTWTTFDTPRADLERNVNWSFTFTPEQAGEYRLLVRAVTEAGEKTPEPAVVHLSVS